MNSVGDLGPHGGSGRGPSCGKWFSDDQNGGHQVAAPVSSGVGAGAVDRLNGHACCWSLLRLVCPVVPSSAGLVDVGPRYMPPAAQVTYNPTVCPATNASLRGLHRGFFG